MRPLLLACALLIACGGETPLICRTKYLDRPIPRQRKYQVCMERARLREERFNARYGRQDEETAPSRPSQVFVATPTGQAICVLRPDGYYACPDNCTAGSAVPEERRGATYSNP